MKHYNNDSQEETRLKNKLNKKKKKIKGLVKRIGTLENVVLGHEAREADKAQEPEVLRPGKYAQGCYITHSGEISELMGSLDGDELFAGREVELKPVLKMLKIQALIVSLKQSAGCGDWRFSEEKNNYYIFFNIHNEKYEMDFSCYHNLNVIFFPKEHKDAIFAGFVACIERGEV